VVSVAGPVLLHFGEPQANAAAISMTAASKLLVKNPEPVIPPAAVAARVSGPVILQATVGKDGTVVEAEVTSGREMLQQAALDLVRQRVYQPYLVNGAPVPFRTTIVVVFKLPDSGGK
jgi:protein TonB